MKNWEANVRKVEPYVPGEQPRGNNIIKLNTNENPYPPSPRARAVLREMDLDGMRRYPDPEAGILVQAIADYYGLTKEQVFVGVGSDDVPIPFTMCGHPCCGFPMKRCRLERISPSARRITGGKTAA